MSVAILDAGAQYCKVIDRRVRELNVHSEIVPLNTSLDSLIERGFKTIIISGGPGSVSKDELSSFDPKIFEGHMPVLGICYGMQLMNHLGGGKVESSSVRKDGRFTMIADTLSPLFSGLTSEEQVLLTHGDQCTSIAEGFITIGTVNETPVAIAKPAINLYGVQFHPEVDLTTNGKAMLSNFLFKIAGLSKDFHIENRLNSCLQHLREVAGERKVLFLLSGGVDSSVCAALALKALEPEQIYAVHINNGFMRKNESEFTLAALGKLGLNVKYVNATLRFHAGMTTYQVRVDTSALAPASLLAKAASGTPAAGESADAPVSMDVENNENNTTATAATTFAPKVIQGGVVPYQEVRNIPIGPLNLHVVNPEEKRKIIGDVFVRVAQETWQQLKLNPDEFLLCQGTLRPDLIESAASSVSKKADVIKTHHNVTDLVKKLSQEGRVIEPLADFHKDEVRRIGRMLGLPEELVERHPFPGPGLAVRILCANEAFVERDFPETTSLIKMIAGYQAMSQKPHTLLSKINAAISAEEQQKLSEVTSGGTLAAHLLPIRSVGVQGDCRSYSYVCVVSSDNKPHWDSLFFMAQIIPRICHNINRVVYAFGPRITNAINDVTVTYLREPVVETLREVDARVNAVLSQAKCMRSLAQMPVILIPVHFDRDPANMMGASSILRSVVLRPFVTSDFMTGLAAKPGVDLPLEVVEKMVEAAAAVPGISRVLYDMTSKPPGTTEWE
uniref:GMP synthase (glutamine-hydrolyzing) n=2 Tax=Mesocestoides corti TaxID=53468 RepID=A0A5K3FG57_MESCO